MSQCLCTNPTNGIAKKLSGGPVAKLMATDAAQRNTRTSRSSGCFEIDGLPRRTCCCAMMALHLQLQAHLLLSLLPLIAAAATAAAAGFTAAPPSNILLVVVDDLG